MENRIILEDGDVVNVSPNQNPTGSATAKVGDIKKAIGNKLGNEQGQWGYNGVHGEALIQIGGGGWMKGRMVLQVAFYPSQALPSQQKIQASSPLDDLRKELNI